MISSESRDARYKRRKAKRDKKNLERSKLYANLDRAFTFSKVMYYADKCCNGVGYKKSTQKFKLHMFTNIVNTCRNIKNGNYKVHNAYKFKINERGKIRDIDAPYIYDNGASMKNKGFIFAINRIKKKLHKWYKVNGYNGYVVTIDFSKFFENCSHEVIHDIHTKYIHDTNIIKLIEDYLFVGNGIALGVEIAQREAAIIPNQLDHLVQTKDYFIERYMDDTFLIVKTLTKAEEILKKYYIISNDLKIVINKNKTKIIPIDKYYNYCKWHFNIDSNGRVIIVPDKSTLYRQRRKIRKMKRKELESQEIITTITSFIAYLGIGNSYHEINY